MIRHVVGVISIQAVKECVKVGTAESDVVGRLSGVDRSLADPPSDWLPIRDNNRRLRSINVGGSLGQEISKETGNEAS
jgi:hypothetical protein